MNCLRRKRQPGSKKYAAVLVFGDIGRSPRMQNHAYELASMTDYHVYLVGFQENKPYEKIASNEKITIVDISSSLIEKLKKLPKFLYLFYAILRVVIQTLQLFNIFLFKLNSPDFVIVQNPPSIPVLSSMFLISKLINMKLIIDFHNYGFTLLALNVKFKPLIWVATKYEKLFAKALDYGLCVSQAMKRDLRENWGIDTVVVYDKPNTAIFKPLTLEEKHNLYKKLNLVPTKQKSNDETLFTAKQGSRVVMKEGRPMLLISSTSWTKDEDFGILFEAMEAYEAEGQRRDAKTDQISIIGSYPNLHLIITGKGPEKEKFLEIIRQKEANWKYITIETKWLEANDYPKLLAAADLGICLHYSSSGVDLPMKVVDMFGAVLPVAAIHYSCIDELVKHGETGYIFGNSKELASLFQDIFDDYPTGMKVFDKFKHNIEKFRERTFDDEWRENVLPIVQRIEKKEK